MWNTNNSSSKMSKSSMSYYCWWLYVFQSTWHLVYHLSWWNCYSFASKTEHFILLPSKYLRWTNQIGISSFFELFIFISNLSKRKHLLRNLWHVLCDLSFYFMWFSLIIEPPRWLHWSKITVNLRFIFISLFNWKRHPDWQMLSNTRKRESFSAWWHYKHKHSAPFLKVARFQCKCKSILWFMFFCYAKPSLYFHRCCEPHSIRPSERLLYFRSVEFSIDNTRSMCVCAKHHRSQD